MEVIKGDTSSLDYSSDSKEHMGIGLNSLQYGVLYLGSHYNTGPYINFPHFGTVI